MIKYMRKEEKDQRYIIYKEPSLFLNCNFCCLWLFRLVDFQTRVDAYQSCLCLCAGFERFGGDWRRTTVVMSSALLCLYLLLFLLKLSRFNFIRFLVRNFIQIPSIRAMQQQQQPRLCILDLLPRLFRVPDDLRRSASFFFLSFSSTAFFFIELFPTGPGMAPGFLFVSYWFPLIDLCILHPLGFPSFFFFCCCCCFISQKGHFP